MSTSHPIGFRLSNIPVRPSARAAARWLVGLLAGFVPAIVLNGVGSAGECRDVWLVSTRHLPECCAEQGDPAVRVERLEDRRWTGASLDELSTTSDGPVVFFIHGNRYDSSSARRQGVELADRLGDCGAGVRVVVYSWPSDRDGPPLADARSKYRRTRSEGWYFAAILRRLDPDAGIGIVGYSYGATIALHGLEHVASAGRRGPTGLVMVTPAVATGAVHPRGSFRGSVESVDRLTILVNSRDEALRFFPFVDPCHQEALGFTGMSERVAPSKPVFRQIDVASIVGKEHSMQPFLDSRRLSCLIAEGILGL